MLRADALQAHVTAKITETNKRDEESIIKTQEIKKGGPSRTKKKKR